MPCRPDEKCCFSCEKWFDINNDYEPHYYTEPSKPELCDVCNQYSCPHCHACGCELPVKTLKAVHAMEKTYEKWIKNNV